MFLNPIFESNVLLSRQLNQAHNVCEGGIGAGECLPSSQCVGIVYTNQCNSDPSDYTCCLLHRCTVSEGTGYCRDASNQTCDGGAYFPGTSYPWPCPGPNNIQCCVKYTNMTNHTDTSTSTSSTTASTGSGTATLPISSSPTNTNLNTSASASSNSTQPTAQPQSQSQSGTGTGNGTGNGLSSSQIGGIVGGVLAAAVLGGLIAFIFWFRRRRRRQAGVEGDADAQQAGDMARREGDADADGAALAATSTTMGSTMHDDDRDHEAMAKVAAMEMAEKDIPMLGGRMRQEMDASGEAVVHELGAEKGGGKVPGGSKLSELPGSMGKVAELPGSEVDFKR